MQQKKWPLAGPFGELGLRGGPTGGIRVRASGYRRQPVSFVIDIQYDYLSINVKSISKNIYYKWFRRGNLISMPAT